MTFHDYINHPKSLRDMDCVISIPKWSYPSHGGPGILFLGKITKELGPLPACCFWWSESDIYIYILVGGLEVFGTMEFYDFPFSWEWNNHPNCHIFQRGRYTTSQIYTSTIIGCISYRHPGVEYKIRREMFDISIFYLLQDDYTYIYI